jgi:hypothetical protein
VLSSADGTTETHRPGSAFRDAPFGSLAELSTVLQATDQDVNKLVAELVTMGCWNRRTAPRERHEPQSWPTTCSSDGALPAFRRRRLVGARELAQGFPLVIVELAGMLSEEPPGLVG